MADPIKVLHLDTEGVVVDTSPLETPPGTLVKAQNAVPDPTGELGVLVKRPGWKQFGSGSGAISGGVGVPISLGSAGPNIQNPFTDITLTLLALITKFTEEEDEGQTVELGPTFNDESDWYFWDWVDDFNEDDADIALDIQDDLFLVEDAEGVDGTNDATSLFPLVFVGDGADDVPDLVVFSQVDGSDGYRRASLPDTGNLKLMPDFFIRGEDEGMFDLVQNTPILVSVIGSPTCSLNGYMYYAQGGYTVGTDFPAVRAYNGYEDRLICRMPPNPDVSSSAPPKSIITLLAANNKIYISTFDGGVNNTAGGTVKGSVYELNPQTGALTKLGITFPTGHLPYRLLWAYGRLWCGTMINSDGDTTAGRVYYFRPGYDSTWTLDNTFANDLHIVSGFALYKGLIYASVHGDGTTNGGVFVRSTTGTWASSDSQAGYEYLDLKAWPEANSLVATPTQSLYAVSYKTDGTANNIRKFSGSGWSTTLTGAHDDVGENLCLTYVISSGTIKPALWLSNDVDDAGQAYNTVDGTVWTRRTFTAAGGTVQNEVISGFIIQL